MKRRPDNITSKSGKEKKQGLFERGGGDETGSVAEGSKEERDFSMLSQRLWERPLAGVVPKADQEKRKPVRATRSFRGRMLSRPHSEEEIPRIVSSLGCRRLLRKSYQDVRKRDLKRGGKEKRGWTRLVGARTRGNESAKPQHPAQCDHVYKCSSKPPWGTDRKKQIEAGRTCSQPARFQGEEASIEPG